MTALLGKTALVTGGSRGIGRAIVEALAADGARVAFSYAQNRTAAEAVAAQVAARGGSAIPIQADAGALPDIQRLFQEAEAALQGLDIVVNSVGASAFGPHAAITPAQFDQVFSVNARGAFFTLQEAANRVREGGRIIHLSTAGTASPAPYAGLYVGSKAAAEHFVTSLARELGARQVTVNIVSPGLTDTEGLILPKEAIAQMVAQTPLGRLGAPADVADVVAFLAGPRGRWMTGQNLIAAGGIA